MSCDKLHTPQYFSMLVAQHGMHWISVGLLPGWNTTTASAHDHNRLGFYLGAGTQTWNDQGPEAVHDADVSTARHLGQRVATHTSQDILRVEARPDGERVRVSACRGTFW